ncbi:GAF domain-containing protein [Ancylothrix sp. C2]|uniref:GAF domain-containing sensor histidine kinase n=1 Tax=Ancylothrix sp. D3o TaxID=2953691 RepID=UPI0021BADB5F|nr:GAF domain-containing protein [Ancylothrix sp. D3o]MCT7950643.1 GAF domain-containing protein [Ancylothrix sp. D3o]
MNTLQNPQTKQIILNQEVLLHRMTNRIRQSLELQEILAATVSEMRALLKSDRVMVYEFHADGSGQVIAESVDTSRLPSMVGLHFPDADIPPQAREQFIKGGVRSIVDVSTQQLTWSVPNRSENGDTIPTSNVNYRPVDPCHIAYLQAMGIQSSLVVPIFDGDNLWGLLVSHHTQSQLIFEEDLELVQQVADQVSIAIAHSTMLKVARQQQQREATINSIASLLHASPTLQLETALEATKAALKGSGGRLYIGETHQLFTTGYQPTPPDQPLEKHPFWTQSQEKNQPIAIKDIYKQPELQTLIKAFETTPIRGLIIIPLHYRNQFIGYLSIFRNEIEIEKWWAGHYPTPEKPQRPRQTFEPKRETKKGQSCPWKADDLELAKALGNHFSMAIQQYLLYQEVQQLNANLENQVKERTAQLQQSLELTHALKQITNQIRSTLDLQTILQTIVKEVRNLLNADRVVIYQLKSDRSGQVTFEDKTNECSSVLGIETKGECFPQECVSDYLRGKTRAINNIEEENISPCHREFLQKFHVQANLIVPINMDDQLWGLLIAHSCIAPRHWHSYEIHTLQQLASQAAIAIQQAELYEQSQAAAASAKAHARQLAETLDNLQQIQTQLIQSEKMSSLGQLVAGVAHEINNPVNFINGNLIHATEYANNLLELLQLYQQRYPNPDAEIEQLIEEMELDFVIDDLPKMLSSMQVGADRIRQIVLSLRNFSRLEQSQMKPVDIHEGIDSTLMILHHRLKIKPDRPGIRLVKEYGNLPLVECYAGSLNQVFMNVISNAIDALDEYDKQRTLADIQAKPSQITIRTSLVTGQRFLDPNSDNFSDECIPYVRIQIADNGPGMPESVRAKIFEPFFTTKEIGKGTGMGLSISRQIVVDKHGGCFECHSQIDRGTEFCIQIPTIHSHPNCALTVSKNGAKHV